LTAGARIIDGRAVATAIRDEVARRASALRARKIAPKCIAVISEGDASGLLYAQTARRGGQQIGVDVEIVPIGAGADTSGAIAIVARIVEEPSAHGVIIQRPLPKRIDEAQVIAAMDPRKDVDCCHPYNFGLLALGAPRYAPATAVAILELLRKPPVRPLAGARVTIIGRSAVVGRPTAMMLTAADATVTICHSKTEDLGEACRGADILICALGKPGFVTAALVKPGATVIDVGTNVVGGRLVGDVDASVKEVAGAITLVPGGVGPVTTAALLRNIVAAAEASLPM
jgi:methylenetetrahydrofolate dehydrogenase (NADP+)/methenyltetrahydrofolate cyclohydrolase